MWALDIEDVERICHEIETDLHRKDMHLAISVVREAFARSRPAFYIDRKSLAKGLQSSVVPLSSDGVSHPSVTYRR